MQLQYDTYDLSPVLYIFSPFIKVKHGKNVEWQMRVWRRTSSTPAFFIFFHIIQHRILFFFWVCSYILELSHEFFLWITGVSVLLWEQSYVSFVRYCSLKLWYWNIYFLNLCLFRYIFFDGLMPVPMNVYLRYMTLGSHVPPMYEIIHIAKILEYVCYSL